MIQNTKPGRARLWSLAVAAAFVPWAQGALPVVNHVVHVSVDGLSALHLQDMLATNAAAYPNFMRLVQEGASTFNARCDYTHSLTLPNHASMWMGRPVLQPANQPPTAHHGYTLNAFPFGWTFHNAGNTNVSYFSSVFDVVHDHGLSTAFFASKSKLDICWVSYNETNGAPDVIGEDNGRNKIDVVFNSPNVSLPAVEAMTNTLATVAPNYTFLHLVDPDWFGHWYSWGGPEWVAAIQDVDGYLGSILDTITSSSVLDGDTVLIVTADHGGGDPFNTHVFPERRLNYTIPFFVWGPGWPAGAEAYSRFANRFDPGTNRLDYVVPRQPLRNGDSGNLAMTILGLPFIPGSTIRPMLGPKIQLTIVPGPAGPVLTWPSELTDYELESSDRLTPAEAWQPVTENIADDGTTKTYPVPPAPPATSQYFRLKKVTASD